MKMIDPGLGAVHILLWCARGQPDAADNRAVHFHRQSAADAGEAAANFRMDAEGETARRVGRIIVMGGFSRRRRGEGLVLGNGDAGDLAPVHPLERDQVPGFIDNGNAHGHADLGGFGAGAVNQDTGLVMGKAGNVQHGFAPGKGRKGYINGGGFRPACRR